VEMHLVARSDQTIAIPRAHVEEHLRAGETIWTESSYKYVPEQIDDLLESCGFNPTAQWIDGDDGFALTVAEAF
jgi:L-histidine N-alpha-methyltransferase